MPTTRAPRADSVRNRRNILDAAVREIAEHGVDVGMDEFARAAGVAVGTLYRHFPTKTDLISAVIAVYIAEVADDAEASLERARRGARAVDEVRGFLERAAESTAQNYAVKAAASGLGIDAHGDASDEARAGAAIDDLLRIAKADGDVRPDISMEDVYLLMSTAPAGESAAVRRRWLELILPGLTTASRLG